jgi:hypothetical protein
VIIIPFQIGALFGGSLLNLSLSLGHIVTFSNLQNKSSSSIVNFLLILLSVIVIVIFLYHSKKIFPMRKKKVKNQEIHCHRQLKVTHFVSWTLFRWNYISKIHKSNIENITLLRFERGRFKVEMATIKNEFSIISDRPN